MKDILHISDLHISTSEKYGFSPQKVESVLNVLLQDIKQLEGSQNIIVDTIFFTGDIVCSGKKGEYKLFENIFLAPLLSALNLNAKDFYFVPGNHDVKRSSIDRFESAYRESASVEEINKLCKDIQNCTEKSIRLNDFNQFKKKWDDNKENILFKGGLFTTYKIDT